jgi:hypothetical protein
MSIHPSHADTYADLGDAWVRYQTALFHQRHVQLGRRCHFDIGALLDAAARIARAGRPVQVTDQRPKPSTDRLRRATIEAIDLCARLDGHAAGRSTAHR